MGQIQDQVLVIFGASGDLTYRKLIPALFDLFMQDLLPKNFTILGVSRTELTNETFRDKMNDGIRKFAYFKHPDKEKLDIFDEKLHYLSIDTKEPDEYAKLQQKLRKIDHDHQTGGNYMFYLSTPPNLYGLIPQFLAKYGLNKGHNGFPRLIIEKPFGEDVYSAFQLNRLLLEYFKEEQLYRIDHYLGKETVQNVLVTRFANGIYEPLWNRNYIDRVEITAAENIGVEGRGGYYDHAGALRDMIQNHLLQLVALVAMEPPTEISAGAIRNEKMKVFQSLRPLKEEELFNSVIRGQYVASNIRGGHFKGYREEEGVDPESRTETYAAFKCYIDNWRWGGVPFYIRTGKRMPTRVSEIVIHFKPTPHKLFVSNPDFWSMGNQLVLRIHPDEGILLKTGMKVPGAGFEVKTVNMDFHYKDLQETYVPGAYERLLLDGMMGDATLYTRGDGLEAAWCFVQPILDFWKHNPKAPLYGYPAGTWGPEGADKLIEGINQTWRYPCKNLADDGIYCEL